MKDFFDTWKFKILVIVAVFLVGIMAYAGANGRLTAAPQELDVYKRQMRGRVILKMSTFHFSRASAMTVWLV